MNVERDRIRAFSVNQNLAWLEADASAGVVVRAFLLAQTDPNDTLFELAARARVSVSGTDNKAMRQLLTLKFEQAVGPWAVEHDIPAAAFVRLGIQSEHLTRMAA